MKFKGHSKENLYLCFMVLISFLVYSSIIGSVAFNIGVLGVWAAYLMGFLAISFIASIWFIGDLRGNAIPLNQRQFPEVFDILKLYCQKLGLKKIPNIYVMQGNGVLNAFAMKFAKRDYIVLYSNVLEVAYSEGISAVSFIIGHELGHIKRSHTGFFKSVVLLPARLMPFLGNAYSRACEYTCDNIGYSLCPEGALDGLLVLAMGKKLYNKVNIDHLIFNIEYTPKFAVRFAEAFSTHPALVKRIVNINELDRDKLIPSSHSYISPKIDDNIDQIGI